MVIDKTACPESTASASSARMKLGCPVRLQPRTSNARLAGETERQFACRGSVGDPATGPGFNVWCEM